MEYKGVTKILLERDKVKPGDPSGNGGTPPSAAALKGPEGRVKRPLGRENLNSNKPNKDSGTLLADAAWNG